jgi:hypothetical protein
MLVILAKTPTERQDIVERWRARGVTCSAVANVAEAVALYEDVHRIEAFVFFDSLSLVELLAWPTMLLRAMTYTPERILIYRSDSSFEKVAVRERYSKIVDSEEELFDYLFIHSIDFPESLHERYFTLHEESLHDQDQDHDNLISLAEAVKHSFPGAQRPKRKKRYFAPRRRPDEQIPQRDRGCPELESSADFRRLAKLAANEAYHQMLGLTANPHRSHLLERVAELRDELKAYRAKHDFNSQQRRTYHRIHVAITEAVYVLQSGPDIALGDHSLESQ